jgi:NAD(P)-dependent dehydrogenase (short-subunit alcohol dehydrogenase family)
MDPAEMEEVVATNLFGTINMSRAVSKGMVRRRKGMVQFYFFERMNVITNRFPCAGCIINISSVLGLKGGEGGHSVYSASKAGVIGFTKSLARELGGRGVRVTAIAPGLIDTDMSSREYFKVKSRCGGDIK